jgi:thymidine phosphorylase
MEQPSSPDRAVLAARAIGLDTLRENVVVLARGCMALRPEHVKGVRKLEVAHGDQRLIASFMIADDPAMLASDEIGLTQPALRRLGAAAGARLLVRPARAPASLEQVRAKISGATLSAADFRAIMRDITAHAFSDMEIAAFLVGCASFLATEELIDLTRAMVEAGDRLRWNAPLVADKHCIGGVPGNRTTIGVVAILAAHGLMCPKTSSRAITSPAGTADTMEVLARVDLYPDELRNVVERTGACIAWGGRANLSPADDILISVERPLGVDTPEQMVASILSKKAAAGATHLLVDLPVGWRAKIRSSADARRLGKLFQHVGAAMGLSVDVIVTDGSQPIGRGVGPALEARDVLAVLDQACDAPQDLRQKTLTLAGRMLELSPDLPGGAGVGRARELLESGAARKALDRIVAAQGPSPLQAHVSACIDPIPAPRDGLITAIDCHQIAKIARLAGAPTDASAGIDLARRVGDQVRKGEPLYFIHACEPTDRGFALEASQIDCGFVINGGA